MNRKMLIIGVILETILVIALAANIATNYMVLDSIEDMCAEKGDK